MPFCKFLPKGRYTLKNFVQFQKVLLIAWHLLKKKIILRKNTSGNPETSEVDEVDETLSLFDGNVDPDETIASESPTLLPTEAFDNNVQVKKTKGSKKKCSRGD